MIEEKAMAKFLKKSCLFRVWGLTTLYYQKKKKAGDHKKFQKSRTFKQQQKSIFF